MGYLGRSFEEYQLPPNHRPKKITGTQWDEIRRRYESGESTMAELSLEFNTSVAYLRNVVGGQSRRYRAHPKLEVKTIMELREQGVSYEDISKGMGITVKALYSIVAREKKRLKEEGRGTT
jgi:DNA invertase Pin-like site-specific DNA recombinase